MPQAEMFPRTEPPRRRRSKITNNPGAGVNQATAIGRRVADLLRYYLNALGNPVDAILQSQALEVAELQTACEQARAELLAGKGDADQLVRLQNLHNRAIRKLGIDRRAKPQKKTLADHISEKAGAHVPPPK